MMIINGVTMTMNQIKAIMFSLLVLAALISVVRADIAAPMMVVNVTYEGTSVNGTFYAVTLSCANITTSANTSPVTAGQLQNISEYNPLRNCYWMPNSLSMNGECANGQCDLYYFQPSDFKMAFYLPSLNRTFITNEANFSGYMNSYTAQLYQNGTATLMAGGSNPPPIGNGINLFGLALFLTIVIEIMVAFAYMKLRKTKKTGRVLIFVLLGNIVSLPIVWFAFIGLLGAVGLILGEIFAIIFEGCFIYYFNKKIIKIKSALLMSLIMNLASAIIGGLILLLLFS